jgi:emp24/gp25L/p24 family/GOLD
LFIVQSQCSGNFDCWEEGNTFVRGCRNIDVWIESLSFFADRPISEREYVWREKGASESVFNVHVEGAPNRYRLCFLSPHPIDQEEEEVEDDLLPNTLQVGFSFRVKSATQRSLPEMELGPDAQRALQLLSAASDAEQHWHNLLDHFDFLRNREAMQRQLMNQTYSKVIGWSILEAVLVITMAIAQVCYWKSFFEQRRYL